MSFDSESISEIVVGNRMLRSIVGWAPLVDNDWHALMQKINIKLANAQQIFSGRPWTEG